MAAFEFDPTGASRTAAQMDSFLRQLQQQQNELQQLANEIARSDGQAPQAAAVRRCAENLEYRAEEMRQCRTVLGGIIERIRWTETSELLRNVISTIPRHPPFPTLPGPFTQSVINITPNEATDFGLKFEESR